MKIDPRCTALLLATLGALASARPADAAGAASPTIAPIRLAVMPLWLPDRSVPGGAITRLPLTMPGAPVPAIEPLAPLDKMELPAPEIIQEEGAVKLPAPESPFPFGPAQLTSAASGLKEAPTRPAAMPPVAKDVPREPDAAALEQIFDGTAAPKPGAKGKEASAVGKAQTYTLPEQDLLEEIGVPAPLPRRR